MDKQTNGLRQSGRHLTDIWLVGRKGTRIQRWLVGRKHLWGCRSITNWVIRQASIYRLVSFVLVSTCYRLLYS